MFTYTQFGAVRQKRKTERGQTPRPVRDLPKRPHCLIPPVSYLLFSYLLSHASVMESPAAPQAYALSRIICMQWIFCFSFARFCAMMILRATTRNPPVKPEHFKFYFCVLVHAKLI